MRSNLNNIPGNNNYRNIHVYLELHVCFNNWKWAEGCFQLGMQICQVWRDRVI